MENKNEHERSRYSQLIVNNEKKIDDLSNDQRKMEDSLLFLNADIQRGYRKLDMINGEDFREGDHETLRLQRMNDEQEQLFKRRLQETEEDVLESYTRQRRVLDDETEDFYKERNDIPWD